MATMTLHPSGLLTSSSDLLWSHTRMHELDRAPDSEQGLCTPYLRFLPAFRMRKI